MATFKIVPPIFPEVGLPLYGDTHQIFMEGEIESSTPQEFRELIKKYPHASIHINSNGGELYAGMEIGRIIRGEELCTQVSAYKDDVVFDAGICYSAAVLAYVGGIFRFLRGDSSIGVHRFSVISGTCTFEEAQIISATVASYLSEMGIDNSLLLAMSQTSATDIQELTPANLKDMKVVNNGRIDPTWDIEIQEHGTYLRGSQITSLGHGKLTFLADGSVIRLGVFYDVNHDNRELLFITTQSYSLRIDDEFCPLPDPSYAPKLDDAYVAIFFILPNMLVEKALSANTIGFAGHVPNPDLFWGFNIEIGKYKRKFATYLSNCLKQIAS